MESADPVAGGDDGRGLLLRAGEVDDGPAFGVEGQGAAVTAHAHPAHVLGEGVADEGVRDLQRPQHLAARQVRERRVGGHAPRSAEPDQPFPGLARKDRLQGRVAGPHEGPLAPQRDRAVQGGRDAHQPARVQLQDGGHPARQFRHLANHGVVLVQVDRAVLQGRQDRFHRPAAGLVRQFQFGLHEHLGHGKAAQLELRLHDVAVDEQLVLHEGVLQGHGLGQGGRDARQPVAPLPKGVRVGHVDLENGETQNRHKDDGDGDAGDFCLETKALAHTVVTLFLSFGDAVRIGDDVGLHLYDI